MALKRGEARPASGAISPGNVAAVNRMGAGARTLQALDVSHSAMRAMDTGGRSASPGLTVQSDLATVRKNTPVFAGGRGVPPAEAFGQPIKQATKGNEKVLPVLRRVLDERPALWQQMSSLVHTVQQHLVALCSGKQDLLSQEVFTRQLAAMRAELAGPTPSPLERLLAERLTLCWLHLHYVEAIYIQTIQKSVTLRQAEFYQTRISKAQARSLSAIRALAQVRRLGVPAVQVNIAEPQVNGSG